MVMLMLLMVLVAVMLLAWALSPRLLKRGGQVLLALVMLGLVGCGTRSIDYGADGFKYSNTGQDTAFGALDVQRRTVTETLDPGTGAVVERVTEETVVKVDAYQGVDAAARAMLESASAMKAWAEKLPGAP